MFSFAYHDARLPFLLYFIFFHSSNTTTEHSASDAGGINDYFIRSANAKADATATASSAALRQPFLNTDFAATPKAVAHATPRREPETTLLDESEEAEGAAETGEDGLPKPIRIGNILFKCQVPTHNAEYSFPDDANGKPMLKRYLAHTKDGHDNDFGFDYGNTSTTKLRNSNV